MGGQSANQPGQLRRFQEIRHSRIHRRTVRWRVESDSRAIFTARRSVQEAWNRHAHRNKSRLAFRPHPESVRGHAAWNGGKRARAGLSRFHLLDESKQSEDHDRSVSVARRTIERSWARLELSTAPRRN